MWSTTMVMFGNLRARVTELFHVLPLGRHAGDQIVLLQKSEAAVVVWLDQVVAVREVAYAAHVRRFAVALEDALHAGIPEIGVRDDAMGVTRAASRLLQPFGLRHRVWTADGGLHVHGLDDVGVPGLGDEVLGEIVSFGQLLHLPSQDRVRFVRLPVVVHEFRVLHVVEVDVRVDKLKLGHIPQLLPNSFRCKVSQSV